MGHPWIFDNEIDTITGTCQTGKPVDVFSSRNKFLGRGLISLESKIRIRLISRKKQGIDRGFIKKLVDQAISLRYRLYHPETDSFRVVYGETDYLPGFICDCFTDRENRHILVYQSTFAGIEPFVPDILDALTKAIHPVALIERNDLLVREKEGLPLQAGLLSGTIPEPLIINENGVLYHIDVLKGQKTGHFLDQQENRKAIMPYCRNAKVLDAFCHTGGFALHAALAGADSVTAVDASEEALTKVTENWTLNTFSTSLETCNQNVFDYLKAHENQPLFDVIILDPPAFTKSRATVNSAIRGYKEINYRALTCLKPGGILVTCSCSHYLTPEAFVLLITSAGKDAHRTLRFIESRQQSKDHPVLAGYPESLYLKFHIIQVD